tara:strand:- start:137 stop:430 length:294 start_codon:yes stop_codon:yes gene_type:complete
MARSIEEIKESLVAPEVRYVNGGQVSLSDEEKEQWLEEVAKNTREAELEDESEGYKIKRQLAYQKELGSWTDQLDMIYHDIDDWKAKVKDIKERFPK